MRNIGIAGPRPMEDKDKVYYMVDSVIKEVKKYHGDDIQLVASGCDAGFGKFLKSYANEQVIKMVEYVVFFSQSRAQEDFVSAFCARHAAFVDYSDEVHIFKYSRKKTLVEDIIDKVRLSPNKDYYIYDENFNILEYRIANGSPIRYFTQTVSVE